jgi:hypothetical protein
VTVADPIRAPVLAAAGTAGAVRISIAAHLGPLWRTGRTGEAPITDVKLFAAEMTAWVAQNLERFAGPRGGDVFVAVAVDRDGQGAAHEYRSGHYAEAAGAAPLAPEQEET